MDFKNLTLFKPQMEYRRFGKTNKQLSVITLGGMRFVHGWNHPRNEIPHDMLTQTVDTVKKAFEQGINHIETAWGYIKSETAYGLALNQELGLKRSSYFLMTKGNPKTADETYRTVETQLKHLQTNYLDFYGWHGLNTPDQVVEMCKPGGSVEALLRLKEQGIIHHVGFSTHGQLHTIEQAINTNLFEFVNLHYYYTFQRNKPAIDLAASKDMGVFIISPNDKGGQLFNAPQKLRDLTAPLTPIQWNARFCLGNPNIHTLTFGLPITAPFSELNGIFPAPAPMALPDQEILKRLDEEKAKVPYAWFDGYSMENDPSGINIPETLRFRTLLKAFDMKTFGQYRYNMLEENDPWYGGAFPNKTNLELIDLKKCPSEIPIKQMILETHQTLIRNKK